MVNLVKTVRPFLLAVALLGVPFVVDTPSATQGASLRLAAACAASECKKDDEYACELAGMPLVGYKCTRGCDPPPAEET